MANIILTGDRPTGRLHLGHFVGSLKQRVKLQDEGNFDKMYVMIADAQALTDNYDNPDKIRDNLIEVALDYLSVGIDPKKVTIFVQSQISELTELTFYYSNLVTEARLKRNPTVKSEIGLRGFKSSVPVGFLTYPISQAADITAFKANIVPVGEDQLPMIEQTREIVRSFNNIYSNVLVEPHAVLPKNEVCLRLPGIDGKAKMSKSLNNCIYLSDSSEVVKSKVMSMYTDPNHIRIEDPGKIEGNVVFTYLDALVNEDSFSKYYSEFNNLDELKQAYQNGGIGDVKIKMFLYNVLEDLLVPIREKRKYYEQRINEVYDILEEGSNNARITASKTLEEVKAAMRINYFDDDDLVKRHMSKYKEV